MSRTRLTACVLLPFSAGYFLSYLFRTINAVIATDLAEDLNLGAADLGFLTAIYFLVLAGAQLPFGAVLDRHGPKMIQSTLLLLASMGALTFALADGLAGLVIGRALLALGVALALMAGFKAIVVWFPAGHVVGANGWLVMLGALGAVTATAPAEIMLTMIGWRGLFAALAGLSALAALLVLFVVPDQAANPQKPILPAASLWVAFRDPRFWRIAPISAIGIGMSWSLQGLWVAPWLRDVDGLDRTAIVQHLSAMAVAVCVGALLFGSIADRLRRVGVKTEIVLAASVSVSIAAQAALLLGCPIPSLIPWSIIAVAGAATVLSFAILPTYFPKEMSGRANAALNLLHVGAAFVLQSGTGIVIAQWPMTNGGYALEAHQAAMAAGICAQLAALGWFILPRHRLATSRAPGLTFAAAHPKLPATWTNSLRGYRMHSDRSDAGSWRLAASICTILCVTLAALLWQTANDPTTIRVTSVASAAPLPFADTDRNGHITNTVFAACCQSARMEILCDRRRVPVPADTHFVIARLVLEFRSEMHWPGIVEVGTRVEWIRKASLMLAQGLFVQQRCVAVAESIVALVDSPTRRPMRIPLDTAQALHSISIPQRHAPTTVLEAWRSDGASSL